MATQYSYVTIRPPHYKADYPARHGRIEEDLTEDELCARIAGWEKFQPFNARNVHIIEMIVNGVRVEDLKS